MDDPSAPARSGPHGVVVAGAALVAGAVFSVVAYFLIVLVVAYWPWVVGALVVVLVSLGLVAFQRHTARLEAARLRELAHLERVDVMTGAEFEELTAMLLERDGYRSVRVVGRAGDRGVDVVATAADGRRIAFQCKRQKKTVGADRIRNLIGAVHGGYAGHVGVLVTSSTFTGPALEEAEGRLVLLDRVLLARWLDGEPLSI